MAEQLKNRDDYLPIKKSHITFYHDFPIYYISDAGEPVLFKKPEDKLTDEHFNREYNPKLFIHKKDEAVVKKNLMSVLNINLAKAISSQGIGKIKGCICRILEEALEDPREAGLKALPETIEILFFNAGKAPGLLEALASMKSNSPAIIEHSVNVLALTSQYCFYKDMPDDEIKTLGLCALLHDAGLSRIDRHIIETDDKLSDDEFEILKTHTTRGYKEIKSHPVFDRAVAMTAFQHHELLDGSGYPRGTRDITFEAQVIGLIDSYEPLKYRRKTFRNALRSYEALQIIKEDVMKGKYNQQVFVDLCSCLIK